MYNGCCKCVIQRDPAVLPFRSNSGGVFPVLSKHKFYTCSTIGYVCVCIYIQGVSRL